MQRERLRDAIHREQWGRRTLTQVEASQDLPRPDREVTEPTVKAEAAHSPTIQIL